MAWTTAAINSCKASKVASMHKGLNALWFGKSIEECIDGTPVLSAIELGEQGGIQTVSGCANHDASARTVSKIKYEDTGRKKLKSEQNAMKLAMAGKAVFPQITTTTTTIYLKNNRISSGWPT